MSYIINEKTNYIMFDGKRTIINENGTDLIFNKNIIKEILENSCIYYGSTLNGRIKAAKNIIESRYKIPIIVSENKSIIFFQMSTLKEIIYFNFKRVKNYEKNKNFVTVFFIDNFSKKFIFSWSIFNNQILKTNRLLYVYSERVKN